MVNELMGFEGMTICDGSSLVGGTGIFRVGLISFEEDEMIGLDGKEFWFIEGLMSSDWFGRAEDNLYLMLLFDG